MLRVCLAGWAVFLITLALIATQAAHAGSTSKAPASHPEGGCSYTQNGEQVEVDGFVYQCSCHRVLDAGSIECEWLLVKAPAHAHKRAKPRHRNVPKFGISTAVISVKRVAS